MKQLLKAVNSSTSPHAKQFWTTLKKAEGVLQTTFKATPLVVAQAKTKTHGMTACTLQVQLCEYRQFRHSLARLQYGLPDDETMRGIDVEKRTTLEPENFVELNLQKKCVQFDIPTGKKKAHLEVPLKAVGNEKMVAARIAAMCFYKIREGMPFKEALDFREELLSGYRGGQQDVPEDSEAWAECRVQLSHHCPLVAFQMEGKGGKTFAFQTTSNAAGSHLEAERIARLCFVKLKKGMTHEDAIKHRNVLYKSSAERAAAGSPAKRART